MNKIKYREIVGSTQVQIKNNLSKEIVVVKNKEEVKYTEAIDEPVAYVSVRASSVVNLLNYENGKVEIGISLPCKEADVEQTFERGKAFVDRRLSKEVAELREHAKERQKQRQVNI